jgi:hypothetical protein
MAESLIAAKTLAVTLSKTTAITLAVILPAFRVSEEAKVVTVSPRENRVLTK